MTTQKLYRSDTNKVLFGVLGGIGEYFEVDPTILRLGYILVSVMTGVFPALVAYFIAVLIVPKRYHPHVHDHHSEHTEKKED